MNRHTEIKAVVIAILIGLPSLSPVSLTRGEVFPDSSVYLDGGANLFIGNGFVTKINLSAQWPGKGPQEAISYYNPLFMIFSGFIWYLFRSVPIVAFFTSALMAILNGWLIFLIARKIFNERVAWFSMLIFLMLPIIRINATLVATEQAGLASGLASVLFLLHADKGKRYLILAGISMGAGFFLQVSSFYSAVLIGMSFLLWRGLNRKAISEAAIVATTVLIIVGGYEIFCYLKTGNIYPIYPTGAKHWSQSTYFAGAKYSDTFPALRFQELDPAFKALLAWRTLPTKLGQYRDEFWDGYMWLSLASLLTIPYFFIFKRRHSGILLLVPGFLNPLLLSCTFYWLKHIETYRYAIFPMAFLLPPTIFLVERAINWINGKQSLKTVGITLKILFIIVLSIHMLIFWIYQTTMLNTKNKVNEEAKNLLSWINLRTNENDLVAVEPASQLIGLSFYLDRPVAPLPYHWASTFENLRDFLKIFEPKYVGIKKVNDEILKNRGYFNNRYHKYLPELGCKKVEELQTRFFDIWKCGN